MAFKSFGAGEEEGLELPKRSENDLDFDEESSIETDLEDMDELNSEETEY